MEEIVRLAMYRSTPHIRPISSLSGFRNPLHHISVTFYTIQPFPYKHIGYFGFSDVALMDSFYPIHPSAFMLCLCSFSIIS